MTWTLLGAAALGYQLAAVATGRTRVSVLAHTWPWAIVVWGLWAGFGLHFIAEGRRD